MDKIYQIIYSPLFFEDLDKITDYIMYNLSNVIAAKNLLDEVQKEINKRANGSLQYEKYISSKNRKKAYYRIYVRNYTIFYTIRDNIMEIRRILYSRMNFNKHIKG